MSCPIINTRTQIVKLGSGLFGKRIKTTLQLVQRGENCYDIHYSSQFNKMKTGKIENMEIPVNSYITAQLNDDPDIRIEVYNCSTVNKHIAIHIKICADLGAFGNRTIYDQVLDSYIIPSKNKTIEPGNISKYVTKIRKQLGYTLVDPYL